MAQAASSGTLKMNRLPPLRALQAFDAVVRNKNVVAAAESLHVTPGAVIGDARDDLTEFIRSKQFNANTMLAMRTLVNDVGTETSIYKELKNVPSLPGSLDEALIALENDHEFLLKGDVFTTSMIERWIKYKRENEIQPLRLRPHPLEFSMYYDI